MIPQLSNGVQQPRGDMRLQAKVILCDPSKRLVQVELRDRGKVEIALYNIPTAFRWPEENEIWTIRRENGIWHLGERVHTQRQKYDPSNEEADASGFVSAGDIATVRRPLERLRPGDVMIDGERILDVKGNEFIALEEEIDEGHALVRENGRWVGKPIADPGEVEGAADRNHVHIQGAASAAWTITHNLGKFPSVTVVDNGGQEVEAEVLHSSVNALTVYFGGPMSGSAYLN